MSKIKVGDTVEVLNTVYDDELNGIVVGGRYKVIYGGREGRVYIETPNHHRYIMFADQVEKVEDKTEYTFAEIIQGMIDGEFEQGSVLKRNRRVLYVRKTLFGYGLSTSNDFTILAEVPISSIDINAMWTVEQPEANVEEMTIEEIQEKLGHKIKIVEQPTNKGMWVLIQ